MDAAEKLYTHTKKKIRIRNHQTCYKTFFLRMYKQFAEVSLGSGDELEKKTAR